MWSAAPDPGPPAWSFANWVASLEWGSVAEWFAAVGTVGALYFSLVLFVAERRRIRRAPADAFTTWSIRRMGGKTRPRLKGLTLYAHNSGVTPIAVAIVSSPHGEPGQFTQMINRVEGTLMPIAPGESITRELKFGKEPPDPNRVLIHITDGGGRQWWRRLETGRYMHPWRAQRMLYRGRRFEGA
jgi:hypothetical protein